jgi:RNA polymerase-associated protein
MFNSEWIPLLQEVLSNKDNEKKKQELLNNLLSLLPMLKKNKYLLGDYFSVIDCSLIMILAKLPQLKLNLPKSAYPIISYAKEIFSRSSFHKAMKS